MICMSKPLVAEDSRDFDILTVAQLTVDPINLVYCWCGVNRSAAVVAYFIVSACKVPLYAATATERHYAYESCVPQTTSSVLLSERFPFRRQCLTITVAKRKAKAHLGRSCVVVLTLSSLSLLCSVLTLPFQNIDVPVAELDD